MTDNLRHAQYDGVGVQIDDPNELLRSFPGWTLEESFIDLTTQSGAPVDTPKRIKFGPAKNSSNNLVSVDVNGVFTILKNGPFQVKTRARISRSGAGAAGSSQIFFWAEVSTDGGTNWSVFGNSVDVRLDNTQDTAVFFDFTPLLFPVGTKLRQNFARSSTGFDAGDLIASSPSAALQALGIPISPSAQVSVYRLNNYPYS